VPLSYIKTCIKDNFWKSWFKEALESLRPINHSPVNDWTIFFLPRNLNKSKIFRFSKLAHFYTTQIVTAHGKFSEYLFNFGKVDSSLCRMCNLEDDSPIICIETRSFSRELESLGISNPDDLRQLIDDKLLDFKDLCRRIIEFKPIIS